MTLPGKANHIAHCCYTPHWGAARRRTPVERIFYDNFASNVNLQYRQGPILPHLRSWLTAKGIATRCAGGFAAQSTVLRGGRVASWGPNQQRDARRRQIGGLRISAVKISGRSGGENSSALSRSTPIPSALRSRFENSPSAPMAHTARVSAQFTIGSMAGRKRPCPSPCALSARSIRNDGGVHV